MTIRRNYKNGFALILLLFVLLSFSSIAVLENMFPNFNQQMQTQIQTEESLQKLLLILTAWDDRSMETRQSAFGEELKHLRSVLPSSAAEVLAAVEQLELQYPAATRGDPVARLRILNAIERLALNQRAQYTAISEALRIASLSSGWAIALLAILSFLLILVVLTRFKSQVLDPLTEIASVLEEWNAGNRMRRVNMSLATTDLRPAYSILNDLFDRSTHHRSF